MKPVGVHHVAICVADAQKGLAFYRDVLGMTQLPRPDLGPGCWLDAGGQQVHLMESDTQPVGANHFAIRVDDIDAAANLKIALQLRKYTDKLGGGGGI